MLEIAAICLVLTALLAYVNLRFIHLPTTSGVMMASLLLSLALVGLNLAGVDYGVRRYEESLLKSIEHRMLLEQLRLELPRQPPPRITAALVATKAAALAL